jgi:hypothetical protein
LIARSKGRLVGGFAVAGLLLGVIGLLWAAFATSAGDRVRATWQDAERQRRDREYRMRAEDGAMVNRGMARVTR